jgi:uncharacterized protein YwbE
MNGINRTEIKPGLKVRLENGQVGRVKKLG